MTLTLDNWKEKTNELNIVFRNRLAAYQPQNPRTSAHDESDLRKFIDQLLELQKKSIIDEAVKRIEKELEQKSTVSVDDTGDTVISVTRAKEIIHNL